MTISLNNIDWEKPPEEKREGGVLLPAGDYLMVIKEVKTKSAKNKPANEYLEIKWEITDGEYTGTAYYDRLNLKNDNAQAVKIAQNDLKLICVAIGVLRPRDANELIGGRALVTLKVSKGKGDDARDNNEATKYASARKGPAQAPAAGAGGDAPWK